MADLELLPLKDSLAENLYALKRLFAGCSDLVCHELVLNRGAAAALLFFDGLVDQQLLDHDLLGHVGADAADLGIDRVAAESSFLGRLQKVTTTGDAADQIVRGLAVLLVDGDARGLAYDVRGGEGRPVSEPMVEPVIRGPKDAFVESLRINTALLRRKIRNPALKIRLLHVGRVTRTRVAVAHIEGLAEPEVLREVMDRLQRVDIDGMLEGGVLEQLIEERPFSPFPQVQNTERPDSVAANLLEGRVAILVDGTPFALLVPVVFAQFLQATEDYYERPMVVSAIRLLRLVVLFIAMLLPSFYVSIITYHQEMTPSPLLHTIVSAREGVPFPALVEALLMEFSFEVLREAGVRLPRAVGQAVSIVGALVIGQAAVQAGIVSAPTIIVVSFTGIASFAIPRFNMAFALRMLRFPFILLAGSLGLFGVVAGLAAMLLHLCSLRSFGVPYLSPVAPFDWTGMKDTILRLPLWASKQRPTAISTANPVRMAVNRQPGRR